ncbi:hypothetical protein [Salmonella enterica]|uniref:hypothetical protein n=1 Tax=Salmonella enterica TaxID=28901 RepID=UPI003A810703
MLIFLNFVTAVIVLTYAAYYGWLGESLQSRFVLDVNEQYDRELLMVMAQVQAGNGTASMNDEGMIVLETGKYRYKVYATDYSDEKFGICYVRYTYPYEDKISYRTDKIDGDLSLSTRKYLLAFKEEYLGIKDPSSVRKSIFQFKKEKVTIK